MADLSIVYPLAGLTLLAAAAIAYWQYSRARRAQQKKKESALAHPERRG